MAGKVFSKVVADGGALWKEASNVMSEKWVREEVFISFDGT
jgi:hypothetical protein